MKTVVTKRRSLTPIAGMPPVSPGAHAMRRGTARKEMTERVTLRASGGAIYEGWALNGSSGGLRAILDLDAKDVKDVKELKAEGALVGAKPKRVSLGSDVQVVVGEGTAAVARRARIVWLQEELDGVVVGLEFMSVSGLHRGLAPPAPAGAEVAAADAGESAKPDEIRKPAKKDEGEQSESEDEKEAESVPLSSHRSQPQRPETD